MAELDPTLQVELLKWREAIRQAEIQNRPAAEIDVIKQRKIRAYVRTQLDDAALTALGLRISSRLGGRVVAEIRLLDAERIAAAPGVTAVIPEQPVKPELDGSVPQIRAPAVWSGTPSYKGRNVIVGIIDSGIDVFHDSFRKADRSKTRILSIWDQNATGGSSPAPFTYGVEYNSGQIEAALVEDVANPGTATFPHTDSDIVGGVRIETGGHGTHVASTAAGDGSPIDTCDWPFTFVGVAPEADIIVVATRWGDTSISEGLQYIFNRATALTKPVVVNMSFGWNLGPHDGTYQLEQDIDALLSPGGVPTPGRAVVKSAGNEGALRRHARKRVDANGSVRFDFDIGSGDVRGDGLDVWFDAAATLALTIDGPPTGGTASQAIPAAGGAFTISGSNVTVSSTAVDANGQKHIRIDIAATAAAPAAPGRWALRFTETSGNAATIDIWVDRENTDVFPVFIKADAVRENTISTPGNAQNVITVGNYDPDRFLGLGNFDLAASSSWGLPLADVPAGRRLRPDIAAPGETIMAANSGTARQPPPCCACCNYLHVDMSGTSMAAPHVTGVVALMFEKNKTLTFEQVRAHLQVAASGDGIAAEDLPTLLPDDHGGGGIGTHGDPSFMPILQNHKWGSGRLDALLAVNTIPPAPGGGGGGGGGGGSIEGADTAFESVGRGGRIPSWPERFESRPAFQLFAALVSTHVDEVRRLIDTNKRVAVVWRRGGGPTILAHLLRRNPAAGLLPHEIGEYSLRALLERLMKVLARFGSESLRSDVTRWGDLVLAAPGSDLDALDARLNELVA